MVDQIIENQEKHWGLLEDENPEDREKNLLDQKAKIEKSCNTYTQRYKMTIMRYFKDKLGMVSLSAFMVDHGFDKTNVLQVSFKCVYFSKKLI